MAIYLAGNIARISNAFTDSNNAGVDPTTVTLKYRVPGLPTVTLTYPANIIRDSAGNYHYDLDTTGMEGTIPYEWISTGVGPASSVGQLQVTRLPL